MTTDNKALALIPQDLPGFTALAEQFAESKLIPSDLQSKPADVFVTLLAGHELGLSPMASLRGIHVVKGKTILSADTMIAVVLSSGACEYFHPVGIPNEEIATYETKRKGDKEPRTLSWTAADTKRAGLEKNDNHMKYPRALNMARCKAALARDVYPDVLAGCYVDGEIVDDAPQAARITPIRPAAVDADVIDAEAVDLPAEKPADGAWPAFVADVFNIAGLTIATEDDVTEAWSRMLDQEKRADIDFAVKGLTGAFSKHKSDYRVTALREKCLASYRARIAEMKKTEAKAS